MKIAIATKNLGKLKEFQQLTKNTNFELIPIPESISELPPETGKTFYENALIKAKFISNALEIPAIGDDSGLEVDALDGCLDAYKSICRAARVPAGVHARHRATTARTMRGWVPRWKSAWRLSTRVPQHQYAGLTACLHTQPPPQPAACVPASIHAR